MANDASTVQYGVGHADVDAPRPVFSLSLSAYRSRYACGSANDKAMTGAANRCCQRKVERVSAVIVADQNISVLAPSSTTRLQPWVLPADGDRDAVSTSCVNNARSIGVGSNARTIRREATRRRRSLTATRLNASCRVWRATRPSSIRER